MDHITLCLTLALPGSALSTHDPGVTEVNVHFHENKGQWPEPVLYRAMTPGGALFVEPAAFTQVLCSGGELLAHGRPDHVVEPLRMHAYKVHFEGGSAASHQGTGRLPHYLNKIHPQDPTTSA